MVRQIIRFAGRTRYWHGIEMNRELPLPDAGATGHR